MRTLRVLAACLAVAAIVWSGSAWSSEATAAEGVSPRSSLLMSSVVPGWGQLANGHPVKGAACFVVGAALVGRIFVEGRRADEALRRANAAPTNPEYRVHYDNYSNHFDRREDAIWWTVFFWLYNMIDAYVDAHLFRFDEGFEGEPAGEGLRLWSRTTESEIMVGVRIGS